MNDEYLMSFHRADLIEILSSKDTTRHFSININLIQLNDHKPELVVDLLNDPDTNLEEWDKAAFRIQLALLKEVDKTFELKNNVHCRVLITQVGRRGTVFPGNKDEGKFMRICGTVMRITAAKLLEYQRNYVCVKCKHPSVVKADYSRKYMIKKPARCTHPDGCSGTNLVHFGELDTDNCKDYQEIKIQEQVKKLGMGSVPNTMWVTLEDDLVDSCQPGDDVTICGTVRCRYGEFSVGKRTDIDLVFKANHIQVDTNNSSCPVSSPESETIFGNFWKQYEQNPLEGRDLILKSFCPEIYGLYPVKLALASVLAGGCSTEDTTSTGVRTRSESHLLLVGDPGTGKSQLLRFASKIVPRAVLTTGVGSTAAGLTVTAMREHGEWQLEAGALVMSDGGICCIDEFNSMKEHDRTTIHEAMEQQTISVAKASMVCKLNTRCAILAACNPKGNIDPTQTMSMNIALPSPLLSRFDLVMMLRDTVNQEWDNLVIDYILNGGSTVSKLTDFGLWPIKNLQTYFKKIKKFQPKLTEDAETLLSTYYNVQRRVSTRNKARTTVRLLESLVRLSQGHARLMYHDKVQIIDSIYAIFLVDIAMDIESSVLNLKTCVNSVFPERPKLAYKNLLDAILNKLQLPEILKKELHLLNATTERQMQSRFFVNQNKDDENILNIVNLDNEVTEIANVIQKNTGLPKDIHDSQDLIECEDGNGGAWSNQIVNRNKNFDNFEVESTAGPVIDYADVSNTELITSQKTVDIKNRVNTFTCLASTEKDSSNIFELEFTGKHVTDQTECDIIKTVNREIVKSVKHPRGNSIELSENNYDDILHVGNTNKRFASDNTTETNQKLNRSKNATSDIRSRLNKFRRFAVNSERDNFDGISENKTVQRPNIEKIIYPKNFTSFPVSSKRDCDSILETESLVKRASDTHCNNIDTDSKTENKIANRRILGDIEGYNTDQKSTGSLNVPHLTTKNDCRSLQKRKSSMFESGFDETIFEDDSVQNIGETIFKNVKKPCNRNKKVADKISSKDIKSSNSVENDLEVLQLLPGVNDDFNIDLSADWDNVGNAVFKRNESKNSGVKRSRCDIFGYSDDIDFNI